MAYNSLYVVLGFWSYVVMALIMIVAFLIHEFSKVIICNTISKNAVTQGVPIKRFIEPIGFIMMYFFGIGWSNTCKINAVYFTNRKKDTLKVYGGAVIANIVIGFSFMLIYTIISSNNVFDVSSLLEGNVSFIILEILYALGVVTTAVGIMNLIPMLPFSGYHIFYELSSPNTKMKMINYSNIIKVIVLFLIFFGVASYIINFILEFLKLILQVIR